MPEHPDVQEALNGIGDRDHSTTAEYRIFGPPGTGKTTNLTRQIRRAWKVLRGAPAVHATFTVKGGIRIYRVNDSYESWFDPQSYSTLRAVQNIDEGVMVCAAGRGGEEAARIGRAHSKRTMPV